MFTYFAAQREVIYPRHTVAKPVPEPRAVCLVLSLTTPCSLGLSEESGVWVYAAAWKFMSCTGRGLRELLVRKPLLPQWSKKEAPSESQGRGEGGRGRGKQRLGPEEHRGHWCLRTLERTVRSSWRTSVTLFFFSTQMIFPSNAQQFSCGSKNSNV